MSRLAKPAIAFLFAAMTLSNAEAAEPHEEWMQYLKGEWTSETQVADGEPPKGESKATIEAEGHALVISTKSERSGRTSVSILGWRSDSKTLALTGYDSDGTSWHAEFTEITDNSMSGKLRGVLAGRVVKGTITRKRVDDDHQESHFEGTADEDAMTLTVKYTRKK